MYDNDNRLDKLEAKMESIESTLNTIKNALVASGKMACVSLDNETNDEVDIGALERAKIDNIMDNFNFQKVHDYMKSVNWRWAMSKEGVPTIDELKKEARRLLVGAVKEKTNLSTGGFRAVYDTEDEWDDDPYIGLEFIIEECEGFDEDEDDD